MFRRQRPGSLGKKPTGKYSGALTNIHSGDSSSSSQPNASLQSPVRCKIQTPKGSTQQMPFPALSEAGVVGHRSTQMDRSNTDGHRSTQMDRNDARGVVRRHGTEPLSPPTPVVGNKAMGMGSWEGLFSVASNESVRDQLAANLLTVEGLSEDDVRSPPPTAGDRTMRGRMAASLVSEASQPTTPIDQLIHQLPIFKDCSYDFVESVLLHVRNHVIKAGQSIVEEGSPTPVALFFVVYGTAEVFASGQRCRPVCTGEYFGEAMIFGTVKKWDVTVIARTQCMVCELPRESLDEVFEDYKDDQLIFSKKLVKIISRRVREDRESSAWMSLRRGIFLGNCSEPFLRDLSDHMQRRLFFEGDDLCRQGDQESAVYVLDHGSVQIKIGGRSVRVENIPRQRTKTVNVEEFGAFQKHMKTRSKRLDEKDSEHLVTEGKTVESSAAAEVQPFEEYQQMTESMDGLHQGALLLEEALLSPPFCSKTATARSVSDVRVLYIPIFWQLLDRYPDDRALMVEQLQLRYEDAFPKLDPRGKFQSRGAPCSNEFFEYLSSQIEHRVVGVGDRLELDDLRKNVHQPQPGPRSNASFCVLNHGLLHVQSLRHSEDVFVEPGSVVQGETFWDKTITVAALETSYISVIHRVTLAKAMEAHPSDRETLIPVFSQSEDDLICASSSRRRDKAEQVTKILRERSIFAHAASDFLDEIVRLGSIRVFMPGERMIEQGTEGTSMFLLWIGTANVVKESVEDADANPVSTLTNVGALTHGSVFGELVMLGVQSKRTASIIAGTLCCTWEVESSTILDILERHPEAKSNFLKLVEAHLDKLAAPQIIHHSVFANLHQQFRTMLAVNCERLLFFPGHIIFRENSGGEKLFIMNLGTAALEIDGQHVMPVTGGAYFGFGMVALGDSYKEKFPGTLVSKTMCQVLVITRGSYIAAVNKYPEMRDTARALEREERQKSGRQKAAFQRMVQRRRGLRCIVDALRGVTAQSDSQEVKDSRMLQAIFEGWHAFTQKIREIVARENELQNSNIRRIEDWLTRRRDQMRSVEPRTALKKLVARNVDSRGPLKITKQSPHEELEKKSVSEVWSEMGYASPYMSPSPVWRLCAYSKRQEQHSRRLPPISRARAVGRMCQLPVLPMLIRSPPRTAPGTAPASGNASQAIDLEFAASLVPLEPVSSYRSTSPVNSRSGSRDSCGDGYSRRSSRDNSRQPSRDNFGLDSKERSCQRGSGQARSISLRCNSDGFDEEHFGNIDSMCQVTSKMISIESMLHGDDEMSMFTGSLSRNSMVRVQRSLQPDLAYTI